MQPRLQNGACSGDGGLPHSGQGFALELGALGMSARDGERGVAAQGDSAANLPRHLVKPVPMTAQHRDHRWMRGNPNCPDFTADTPEQGPRFERRPVGRQFEQ